MIEGPRVFSRSFALGISVFFLFFAIAEFLLLSFNGGGLPPHYSPWATLLVYVSGLVVTPLLMLGGTKSPRFVLPAVVWVHITMGVLLVWFSEIFSPFTPIWSLVILFASMYYGWKGFTLSSLSLAAMAVLYIYLFSADLTQGVFVYIGLSAMVVFATIAMSFLFVSIIMNSRKQGDRVITSQKSEQLQANRLNTLINSMSDAVLTLNRYGRITSQNAAAQAFFDTNQSLIGRDISKQISPFDENDQPVDIHELINSTTSTLIRDDLRIGSGGDSRRIAMQMSRIRSTFDDDEEYGVVMIIRDITKQKSLEEEKDEFISVASHELRTPVAIAEGSLSNLMVMFEKDADKSVLQESSKMAYDQVIYLSRIINDLSTLSRAERGVGDVVEEIDVTSLLHELFNRYEPEAKAKSLHLNLDVDSSLPHVETSRLYLEEMMQNFITNSIKYTKEGSVTISAKLLENGRINCSVTDTGIGMSKHDLDHIFEKFYRSEDYRTRETSGTGLGLYVVKKLADKLETVVEVDSRLNHGSTFSFVLPLKTRLQPAPVATKGPEPIVEPVIVQGVMNDDTEVVISDEAQEDVSAQSDETVVSAESGDDNQDEDENIAERDKDEVNLLESGEDDEPDTEHDPAEEKEETKEKIVA